MSIRKKTPPAERARRSARKAVADVRTTGDLLRETWSATVTALTAAEAEMERQLTLMLKRNKVTARDASAALGELRARFEKERRRAARELESRVGGLQSRVEMERKNVSRAVDSAVHGALATFNIPNRQEVAELTRKVEELTRRIDGARVTAKRAATRRARAIRG